MKYNGPTLLQIEGGKFLTATRIGFNWRFEFVNELILESVASWRVTEQRGFSKYPILGPLDYNDPQITSEKLQEIFLQTELKVLCFEPGLLSASMQGEGKLLTLELLGLSMSQENWRIYGEDFEDSDKKMLLASRQVNDA